MPKKEAEVGIGRASYLSLADKSISEKRGICFVGQINSGKTFLLRKIVAGRKNGVFIDLEKLSVSPESFAVEFTSAISSQILAKPLEFSELEKNLKQKSKEAVLKIKNELEKIKPDQKLLLELSFSFPELIAEEERKEVLIGIDNFDNILDMNNFSQIADVIQFFNSLSQKKAKYVLASSMKLDLNEFEIKEIENLNEKEGIELVKQSSDRISDKDAKEIFNLSRGNPFLIKSVCKRFDEVKDARKAFSIEVLQVNSPVFNHFHFLFNDLLNKARGKSLLRNIMKVIALNDDLRLTEISRKIYKIPPVTKAMLERLMEVGLVFKTDNKFSYKDPLLKLWAKYWFMNKETDNIADVEIIENEK